MQKDFKTGMIVGIPIAGIIAILLAVCNKRQEDFTVYIPSDKPVAATITKPIAQDLEEPQIEGQTFPKNVPAAPLKPKPVIKYHIVQKGETLSSIAQQYYHNSQDWKKILDANKDIITNEHRLTNGAKLIIP